MSRWKLIVASLLYHRRSSMAVALGVAVGAAVLSGALIVGDCVRGSLLDLAIDRLGRIDDVLVVDRFFREELANGLALGGQLPEAMETSQPAILLSGSVEQPDSGTRASQVMLLGCEPEFWRLTPGGKELELAEDEIAVNAPLAARLHVQVGADVIVRLPTPSDVPRDSPLGRTTELVTNRRLKLKAIVPASGLGSFSLLAGQQAPLNAYLNRAALAEALDEPHRANAIFVAGRGPIDLIPSAESDDALQAMLHPSLDDYGLSVDRTKRGYLKLGSRRMLLDEPAERSAMQVFADEHPQPILTYLANTIAIDKREIPYSTVTGIDFTSAEPLGPFRTPEGNVIEPLADNEIVLNDWAARQLDAKVGEPVRLVYFEPESTHGVAREATATFKLKAVAALEGPAADPDLTPTLKGVTDQLSIADWNPPFPFDARRVRPVDEKYWDEHRATPKAFVSLSSARKLWASRFGRTTAIRLPASDSLSVAEVQQRWRPDPKPMGFEFRPVKRLAATAARGTTPFSVLFLGFSFFIIVSAVMLVGLLFRLAVERRASEIGVLLATGFTPHQVGHLLLAEGSLVALLGAIIGAVAGLWYAELMVWGLNTWWLPAIGTPFLRMHVRPASLVIGLLAALAVSLLGIVWALWMIRKASARQMLSGQVQLANRWSRLGRASRLVVWACLAIAVAASIAGGRLEGMAQAGAFFAAGSAALVAALGATWRRLAAERGGGPIESGTLPLARLALRNAGRNPGRSTLTIALVASAAFLLVAVSAFRLEPPARPGERNTGTGGYALIAQSDQPIFPDLNQPDARSDLGFSAADDRKLSDTRVYSARLHAGQDASCLNLFQTRQPTLVGATPAMIERGGFAWAASQAESPEERANPWLLLSRMPRVEDGQPIVPAVLDAATANYSLHLGLGSRYEIDNGRGGKLRLEVVGLLANSMLQGMIVIGEQSLLAHFPGMAGYRFFLIDAPAERAEALAQVLNKNLGDYGFDARPTTERLGELLAVQNTYLSTFQALGGLGLLLGTFGLAAVQLRNVLERRGELALLRAVGFRRKTLVALVLVESAALLTAGLAIGIACAALAIAPQWLGGAASVPWQTLAATLAAVLATGLLATLAAARTVATMPLLPALRGE